MSESDLIEYTPPEESDDSLINDCLVIGKEKFSLIESVTQDGGGYAAGGETWGPTGCVITDLAVKAGSLANTYDNDTATSGTLEFSSQGTIKWGWDGQDVYKFKIYTSQFKDDGAANTKTLFNTGVTATINPGSGGDLDYTRDDNTDTYVIWGIDTTYTGEITVITYPLVSAEPVNRVYIMGEQVLPAQDGYRTKLTTIEVYDNTATWKTAWTGSSEFFINYYEYVMFSLSTIYYGVTQIRFTIELHCDNTAGSTKRFYLYDMCFDAYSDNNTYISKIEYYQNQTWNVDSQDISWYPTEYSWEIRDFAATRTCSSVRLTINSEDASRLTPSFNEIEIMTATTPGYFYISTLSARAAQQFEAKEDYLSGFKLYLNRSTGDYTPSFLKGGVYTDSGDAPGTLVTNSDKFSISTSDVPNPPMWAKDYFEWNYEDEELALTKGANYWLVLQGENTISSATGAPERYWQVGKSSDDYFGLCKTSIDASQSWVNQAGFNLKMYIGWIKKPLTGDYQDTTSINNYGRYYNKVEDDTILTETEAETLAENIVTKYKDPLKRGNVTIDGTLDAKIGEDIIINLSRLGVNETTPIRSYSHIIDGTGFKTSIQWGEHEYSLAKEIAKLRGEV